MNEIDIGTAMISYRVFGAGKIKVVIEGALNSCCAEWWNFCNELSGITAFVYDRAGYGESSVSELERTPENITRELEEILKKLGIENEVIVAGHSQGGLYATLFALRNPAKIKALILLDPLSVSDNRLKKELDEKEYYSSGADKSKALKIGRVITALGLGFLFKRMLKKAPPFCYEAYDTEAEKYILKALTQKKQYETALKENAGAHEKKNLDVFKGKITRPICLIRHDEKKMIDEIMHYGNCKEDVAEKVEKTWQSIMKDMLAFSDTHEEIVANNSSHYIHLTDRKLVIDKIKSFI